MFASNNEADLSTMDMILGFIKEASIVNPPVSYTHLDVYKRQV